MKGYLEQARPGFEQLHKQLQANAELLMSTRPDDPNYTAAQVSLRNALSLDNEVGYPVFAQVLARGEPGLTATDDKCFDLLCGHAGYP